MLFANLSVKQILHAASIKQKIEALQQAHQKRIAILEQELVKLVGQPKQLVALTKTTAAETPAPAILAKVVKRSKISAAGRANIVAAQKARWAKLKAAAVALDARKSVDVSEAKAKKSPQPAKPASATKLSTRAVKNRAVPAGSATGVKAVPAKVKSMKLPKSA